MSITFDAASSARDTTKTSTTLTLAHTIAAASELLFVFMFEDGTSTGTCTYNSVAMTEVPVVSPKDLGGTGRLRAFYQVNPTSGAHNIVGTWGSTTQDHYLYGVSYIGPVQQGIPDAASTNSTGGATSLVSSVTTVANNCWSICAIFAAAGGLAASTGSTLRGSIIGAAWGVFDSNAAITPAGAHTMTQTFTNGTALSIIISFSDIASFSVADTQGSTDTASLASTLIAADTQGSTDTASTKFGWGDQSKSSSTWSNTQKS